MQILIVRHGLAGEPDPERWPNDGERPLTDRGRRAMRRAARGLASVLERPGAIWTSPLVRCRQTAEVLSRSWKGRPRPTVADVLAPDHTPEEVGRWLKGEPDRGTALLVGHEPGCSLLLGWLCAGAGDLRVDFKKGAMAMLEVERSAGRLRGRLLWFAPTRLLRRLC